MPAKPLVYWELVNPSDAYVFLAPNTLVAACACILVGHGQYAATPEDGSDLDEVPLFIFGGAEEWFKERGVTDIRSYIDEHREGVAGALDSFLIGSIREHKAFNRMMEAISDPAEREKARLVFHDEQRSSLNDIGAAAWAIAKKLRAQQPIRKVEP